MELRQLQWFTVLADELHYGRAAERIPVAKSALSATITKLEKELGVTLIDRGKRAINLTPAGTELAEHAHQLLNAAQTAINAVQTTHTGAPQHLRLGVFQHGAAELNGPIVRAIRNTLPNTTVEIVPLDFVNHFTAITDGHVDLAIVRPPTFDDRIQLHPLFSEPMSVMLNHGHHLADANTLTRTDVIDQAFVTAQDSGVPDEWADYWAYNDIRGEEPKTAGTTGNDVATMIDVVAGTRTGLLTTAASVSRNTLDPDAKHIPLDDPDRRSHIAIATSRHHLTPYQPQLIHTAQRITTELINLIPGGQLEHTTTPGAA